MPKAFRCLKKEKKIWSVCRYPAPATKNDQDTGIMGCYMSTRYVERQVANLVETCAVISEKITWRKKYAKLTFCPLP